MSDDAHPEFLKRFLACEGEIRAYVRSVVRDRESAEEIFQEVALVLWKTFERYDPARPFGVPGVRVHRPLS